VDTTLPIWLSTLPQSCSSMRPRLLNGLSRIAYRAGAVASVGNSEDDSGRHLAKKLVDPIASYSRTCFRWEKWPCSTLFIEETERNLANDAGSCSLSLIGRLIWEMSSTPRIGPRGILILVGVSLAHRSLPSYLSRTALVSRDTDGSCTPSAHRVFAIAPTYCALSSV
jgi:hypothetical protein